MLEVLRIREELINRLYETYLLKQIYQQQCRLAGKQPNIKPQDSILNIQNNQKDFTNHVDMNDGNKIQDKIDLDFIEFDTSLCANLDFKSESCIKALFLDLGVEEMRAILHYQVMQQHLLLIAVKTNQFLLDGPQKGLTELQLIEKNYISVPNAVVDVELIQQDVNLGRSQGIEKKETARMKNLIMKSFADYMYQIIPKKNRYREKVGKQFQTGVMSLAQRNASKPETLLRIQRSFRIKLLHLYCNAVQRDIYCDSIKIQTLHTANELRRKALLFPQNDQKLFKIQLKSDQLKSDEVENLSFKEKQYILQEQYKEQEEHPMDLESIITAQITHHTLFYVPSTEEIMKLDRITVDEEAKLKEQVAAKMLLDPEHPDQDIKDLVKCATRFENYIPKYKTNKNMKFNIRKVNFKEAYEYDKDSFLLLCYLNQILSIFNLEYAMGKNATQGSDVLELENHVLTGREFWGKVEKLTEKHKKIEEKQLSEERDKDRIIFEQKAKGNASQKVIEKILYRKKRWIDLSEDLINIRDRLELVNSWMRKLPHERKNLGYICDMLILQHQSSFLQFLNGLESILELYRDKQNDQYFAKVIDCREAMIKRQSGVIVNLKNGYYVTQAGISPLHISLEESNYDEFESFYQAYSPIIDELELIPKQVRVLKRCHGQLSKLDSLCKDSYARTSIQNYAELRNAFMNIDDADRSQIFWASFQQCDEENYSYLKYKNLIDPNEEAEAKLKAEMEKGINNDQKRKRQHIAFTKSKDHEAQVLQAKVEMLSFKIEAGMTQRIMMSWLNGGSHLPRSTKEYSDVLCKYKDLTMMRILQERQRLNEIYWGGGSSAPNSARFQKPDNIAQQEIQDLQSDRKRILDGIDTHTPQYVFFNKVNLIRAETVVIRKLFDSKLIKIGIQTIQNEHAALTSAFEENGTEIDVQAFVHPQQQFAATMYQDCDKLQHLDIITKLGFVQHYLSRLRNRAQEVQTLTSGPSIVFTVSLVCFLQV